MYGRMQLADYLVSRALQINNNCLLRLSRSGAELSNKDLEALRIGVGQLLSFWQMLRWSVGRVPHRDAVKRLRRMLRELPVADDPVEKAAKWLLKRTEGDKTIRAIEKAINLLTGELVPLRLDSDGVDRLNCLFQDESAYWRDHPMFRHISDDDLIDNGITRSYVEGRRRCALLISDVADKNVEGNVWDKPRKLKRGLEWIRHNVNHLELLQPSLSDSNTTRLWHLQKLALNLEKQRGLHQFVRAVDKLDMKTKSRHRIEEVAGSYKHRILRQRRKLYARSYQTGKREFRNSIREDVHNLGLQEVVLLPIGKAQSGELG